MIYILIFVWQAYGSSPPTSSMSVEFKDKESCMLAAEQVKQQATRDNARVPLLMCARKGV